MPAGNTPSSATVLTHSESKSGTRSLRVELVPLNSQRLWFACMSEMSWMYETPRKHIYLLLQTNRPWSFPRWWRACPRDLWPRLPGRAPCRWFLRTGASRGCKPWGLYTNNVCPVDVNLEAYKQQFWSFSKKNLPLKTPIGLRLGFGNHNTCSGRCG